MAKKHGWGRGQLKEKGQRRQAMGWAGSGAWFPFPAPFTLPQAAHTYYVPTVCQASSHGTLHRITVEGAVRCYFLPGLWAPNSSSRFLPFPFPPKPIIPPHCC